MIIFTVHLKNSPTDDSKQFGCSKTEWLVLELLGKEEMIAPQISRLSGGVLSQASCYKLLSRLEERGLVIRKQTKIEVTGTALRRFVYSSTFDEILTPQVEVGVRNCIKS